MKLNELIFICICSFSYTESPIKSKDLDLSQYSSKQLSPDYRIHWRILKDKNEIEIVAVVNSTSWIGLGWRPRKLNSTCRNFPLIQGSSSSKKLQAIKIASNEKVKPEPESRKHKKFANFYRMLTHIHNMNTKSIKFILF